MAAARVQFGDEKYAGIIEPGNAATSYAAIITLAEWQDWENGEEAALTDAQLTQFLDGLAIILKDDGTEVEVLFGLDEKYAGRLTRLGSDQSVIDLAEWSDWVNEVSAVITGDMARQILALFNR
jgi:hypothetical protein